MIRLLNEPDCSEALLRVVEFQRQLFEFAVEHESLEREELRTFFGEDITKWLWQEKSRLIDSLINENDVNRENFLEFPYEKKKELYTAFCNDINFHIESESEIFSFELGNDCKEIKDWLIKFFDVLKDNVRGGFPPSITGLGETLNSNYWWESIHRANGQDTCPICDTLLVENNSIEHFLPKSIYPALSIHPFNLFPSCEKCNNKKGDKDPLLNRRCPYILHPYYHPLEDDSEIHFNSSEKKEVVVLRPDCRTAQEFSRLFILPERWNNKMYRFIERCGYETLGIILKYSPNAKHLSKEQIISIGLDEIRSKWGKKSYAFIATQWISEIAPQKWDSIIAEISS